MAVLMEIVHDYVNGYYPPGTYLQSFNVDENGGRGSVMFTAEIVDAMRFPDLAAAMAAWKEQSTVMPLRPDGKPNRPLTAYTVTFIPAS